MVIFAVVNINNEIVFASPPVKVGLLFSSITEEIASKIWRIAKNGLSLQRLIIWTHF